MTYYKIKKGEDDDSRFIRINYKEKRLTKPLIFGLERFFEHWNELEEWEKDKFARLRVEK